MRPRERFILTAILLGALLWVTQLVPINWRYSAIIGLSIITCLVAAWALRNNLKWRHWLTFLPLPAIYSLVIGQFYFLLPTNFWSMIFILALFAIGMYTLLLTGNIFLVTQQGRTIQLTRAAQNIALFFAIIISLLGVQVIFSFAWPFYLNFGLVFLLHFPLVLDIVWSVNINEKLSWELFNLTFLATLIISEIALALSFLPLQAWHIALLIMSIFYLILGILQVFLSAKLFRQALNEYIALAVFIVIMYIAFFPGK